MFTGPAGLRISEFTLDHSQQSDVGHRGISKKKELMVQGLSKKAGRSPVSLKLGTNGVPNLVPWRRSDDCSE
ncbi:unnamed protein product [Parnassius apollo]|uniref:(apollo) hypothetical protein n=1 Tax=Parnassius apollo TaxID=110799 RepID=A0A8S3XE51_PARAO|nr:unnamed protein product [Parnassius apollo]